MSTSIESRYRNLVSITALPTKELQSIFAGYPSFNAVQSGSFSAAFGSDQNLVVTAPTGSGKTAILELAICRLLHSHLATAHKIVYMAPTKSLCRERVKDWSNKFRSFGRVCAEVTGDTDARNLQQVRSADIIITTPEKWDSITRRWQDSERLMQSVRLFMVDEAHILSSSRGATLEVALTRMKQLGHGQVRMIALSATVPNLEDLARWVGNTSGNGLAMQLKFGEEYRPVALERVVYGYDQGRMNKFAFDSFLSKHVHGILAQHGKAKPAIVFCSTRQDCVNTAKALLQAQQAKPLWKSADCNVAFADKALQSLVADGIAFHHAGLSMADRNHVETLFRANLLCVLCCTSTLAVGVNLPAHLVILKNTLVYSNGVFEEYSDLDVLQMIGRAGRPQFDTSGCAVIMTANTKKAMYEQLVTGTEVLESHLHLALLEHFNAEISSGSIKSLEQATDWLKRTFLYVRMKQNPAHYRMVGHDTVDDTLQALCRKDLALLEEYGLTQSSDGGLHSTALGDIMANYYLRFKSFQEIVNLPDASSQAIILEALCKAEEFGNMIFRSGDKGMLNQLKACSGIKFTIDGKVEHVWQKVFLAAQVGPGCIDLSGLRGSHLANVTELMGHEHSLRQHLLRLLSCMIDCKLLSKDATSIHNALELRRAVASKCWKGSPAVLKQIRGIGDGSLKTLVNAGIRSLGQLKQADPRELERLFKRNPPFGNKLVKDATSLPTISLHGREIQKRVDKTGVHVHFDLQMKASCEPQWKPEMRLVNFTASTDTGVLLDFRRQRLDRLLSGKQTLLNVSLQRPCSAVKLSILCEDLMSCEAELAFHIDVDASKFPEQDTAKRIAASTADEWVEVIDQVPDIVDLTRASAPCAQSKGKFVAVQPVSAGQSEDHEFREAGVDNNVPHSEINYDDMLDSDCHSPSSSCLSVEEVFETRPASSKNAMPSSPEPDAAECDRLSVDDEALAAEPLHQQQTVQKNPNSGSLPKADIPWLGDGFVISDLDFSTDLRTTPSATITFGNFEGTSLASSEEPKARKRLRFEDWKTTSVTW